MRDLNDPVKPVRTRKPAESIAQKKERLALMEEQLSFKKFLPHLYGYKMYPWMRKYFDSRNKVSLICSANQIGKSSIQIRKCIHWATSAELRKELWPHLEPRQFWYLYPSSYVATIEFEKKWMLEFLPQQELQKHPVYGWRADYRARYIQALHFNSGISVYFKTYSQDPQDLQAGTCFVAGTRLVTKRGLLPIESVKHGDLVLGNSGWNRVVATMDRPAEILHASFSNGAVLEGTGEHPIFTKSGWVSLGRLTSKDTCRTLPGWKKLLKLYCLTESCLSGRLTVKTQELRITLEAVVMNFCMFVFGRLRIKSVLAKNTACTTKTITHSTTDLKTYNYSQERSTQGFTRLRNGEKGVYSSLGAESVVGYLNRVAQKNQFLDTVLKNVASFAIPRLLGALSVANRFLLEKMRPRDSVLSRAPIVGSGRVYNIEVDGDHTYYANGTLTHNCAAIFGDEEIPEELYPELQMRLAATDGYFSSVFTPTLGQEFWRLAVEHRGYNEKFPDALKLQVSMYDCLYYEDGSPSFWTKERIEKIKAGCKSDAEIQRRIYGKFILDSGLRYPSFSPSLNIIEPREIPTDWPVYIGVDSGSGGKHNHPAAITFVAMRPDFQLGYVFKGIRFDGITTTASDLVEYVRRMKDTVKNPIHGVFYDWASPDLREISSRMGEAWTPAEKSHLIGEQVLNVAFKNKMLQIFDTEELQTLVIELKTNRLNQNKITAHDDHIDATRYAVTKIPWDWSKIGERMDVTPERVLSEIEQRKKFFNEDLQMDESMDDELEMWNNLMEI